MTYPSGPQLRKHLNQRFALVSDIAQKRRAKGETEYADGMDKAVRILMHQLIGEGSGCVITALDPRRDDPVMSEALASIQDSTKHSADYD